MLNQLQPHYRNITSDCKLGTLWIKRTKPQPSSPLLPSPLNPFILFPFLPSIHFFRLLYCLITLQNSLISFSFFWKCQNRAKLLNGRPIDYQTGERRELSWLQPIKPKGWQILINYRKMIYREKKGLRKPVLF